MDYGRWLNCAWMSAMRTNRPHASAAIADAAFVLNCSGAFFGIAALFTKAVVQTGQ